MKVIKKELVIQTAADDGIKGKFNCSLLDLVFCSAAERDILSRFDHPFIMQMEFAF